MNLDEMTPDAIIQSTIARVGLKTNKDLAEKMNLTRQTLAVKRKHPSLFTGAEIAFLEHLLKWTLEETRQFIRGCANEK